MKSILLHIHADAGQESRLQAAFDLARTTDGHISCLQVTPLYSYVTVDPFGGSYMLPSDIEYIRTVEAEEQRKIEERFAREDVPWDWRHRDGEVVQALLEASCLADVIVATLPEKGPYRSDDPIPLVPELAVTSRCPVLAIPTIARPTSFTGRALVAWDGSAEASAALRAALSLLAHAREVHLVTVEEKGKEAFPLTDACTYLSRHGIKPDLHEWPRDGRTIEEALLDAAQSLAPDYLVMGAFGHGRLRETIFGGVTRYLLGEATVPLLLSH